MDEDRVRTVVRRKGVQPAHLGVGIEGCEQTQQFRYLDRTHNPLLGIDRNAAQMNGSPPHRVVDAFHRCELRGLRLIDEARTVVTRDAGEHDRHRRHGHPKHQAAPVQHVVATFQEPDRVDRCDQKACHDVRRDQHVRVLGRRGRVERGRHGVDVQQAAVAAQTEPGRRVHPCVGHHHKDSAHSATHCDRDRG